MVRLYQLYADQEHPPPEDPTWARDVKIRRGRHGSGQVVITLSDIEIEEFAAALQAFIDRRYRPNPVDESSAEDTGEGGCEDAGDGGAAGEGGDTGRPVDESSAGDESGEAPLEEASRAARKADAFMDLVGSALAAADDGHSAGDDRYLVHIITSHNRWGYSYLDGTPVHPTDAATVACDCSTVTHTVTAEGEPLNLGRKTREWNTAQRRAIAVRDGGRCRFPGCNNRHYDIHHLSPWEEGGHTDIANGCCQCRRHHRMIHAGYQIQGDPNGPLVFYRPDGTHIGTTHPATSTTLHRQPALLL